MLMCWQYGGHKIAKEGEAGSYMDCGKQRELMWSKRVCLVEYGI